MKTTRMITADMLSEHKACTGQYELFCMTWPDGCKVTLEDCKNAVRLGLDIYWASQHLLGKAELDAYHEDVATALKAFYEAVDPARKEYYESVKAYDEAFVTAQKAYDEAVDPARKAFDEAKVIAFYEAWHRA